MKCSCLIILMLGVLASPLQAKLKPRTNFWQTQKMSTETLLPALNAGANYLIRSQLPGGDFVYVKDPLGRCCSKKPKYSIIRHLGAVYALLKSYEVTKNRNYLNGARKGLQFIQRMLVNNGKFTFIQDFSKKKPTLGSNGFFLIDLVKYDELTNDRQYRPLIRKITQFLIKHTKYDGQLATSKKWGESQALIGLAHSYYYIEKNSAILPVIYKFLTKLKENNSSSHWTVQANWWYLKITDHQNKSHLEYVMRRAHTSLSNILTGRKVDSQLIGSKNGKLVSCPATARNEGLISAYKIAQRTKSKQYKKIFKKRIKEHLAFAMQFQYGNKGHLLAGSKKHQKIARIFDLHGGVYNKPEQAYIRIDYVAHHLRAIAEYIGLGRM